MKTTSSITKQKVFPSEVEKYPAVKTYQLYDSQIDKTQDIALDKLTTSYSKSQYRIRRNQNIIKRKANFITTTINETCLNENLTGVFFKNDFIKDIFIEFDIELKSDIDVDISHFKFPINYFEIEIGQQIISRVYNDYYKSAYYYTTKENKERFFLIDGLFEREYSLVANTPVTFKFKIPIIYMKNIIINKMNDLTAINVDNDTKIILYTYDNVKRFMTLSDDNAVITANWKSNIDLISIHQMFTQKDTLHLIRTIKNPLPVNFYNIVYQTPIDFTTDGLGSYEQIKYLYSKNIANKNIVSIVFWVEKKNTLNTMSAPVFWSYKLFKQLDNDIQINKNVDIDHLVYLFNNQNMIDEDYNKIPVYNYSEYGNPLVYEDIDANIPKYIISSLDYELQFDNITMLEANTEYQFRSFIIELVSWKFI